MQNAALGAPQTSTAGGTSLLSSGPGAPAQSPRQPRGEQGGRTPQLRQEGQVETMATAGAGQPPDPAASSLSSPSPQAGGLAGGQRAEVPEATQTNGHSLGPCASVLDTRGASPASHRLLALELEGEGSHLSGKQFTTGSLTLSGDWTSRKPRHRGRPVWRTRGRPEGPSGGGWVRQPRGPGGLGSLEPPPGRVSRLLGGHLLHVPPGLGPGLGTPTLLAAWGRGAGRPGGWCRGEVGRR